MCLVIVSIVLSPIVILPFYSTDPFVGLVAVGAYIGSGLCTYIIKLVTFVFEDESPIRRILSKERISSVDQIVRGWLGLTVLIYFFWFLS